MKIIPFDPGVSSIQNFNVNLGELVCDFTIRWNIRAQAWFCDFQTSSGANNAVQLVENSPLLGDSNFTGLFGDFRVIKNNKSATSGITYDNLGSDWVIVYASYSEWETFDGV